MVPEYARCLHERSWVTLLCMQCTKPYMQPVGNFFTRETASSMDGKSPTVFDTHRLFILPAKLSSSTDMSQRNAKRNKNVFF